MDDLDLEKLKKELDDVSGGSCYDVDDILREAGADTPEAGGEELEQLMKQFGITVEQKDEPAEAQAATAPVQQNNADEDTLSGIQLAAQQTETLAAEQEQMAQEMKSADASDLLAEQEELFAQLFTRLDNIEQQPLDDLLESPTQAMPVEQETQVLEMDALHIDEPDTLEKPKVWDEPELSVDLEESLDEPEQLGEDELELSVDLEESLDEPEQPDEDEPEPSYEEESDAEAPKRSFFERLFGFDESDEEEDEEIKADEDEPEEQAEVIDESEEQSKEVEGPDEDEDSDEEKSNAEAPKRSFFARLFGFDEDEDELDENEIPDEPVEELEEVEPLDEPAEEPEEVEPLDEPIEEPEEIKVHNEPEDTEVTDEQREDAGVAAFADALAQEAAVEVTEETPEPPRPRPEDTPVISEAELQEFLSSVKTEDDTPRTSFEQLLRDNGLEVEEDEPKPQKISLKEFPDEETTVYVDVPVRKSTERQDEPRQPEVFDIEAEEEIAASSDKSEQVDEIEELDEPLTDPDWLGLPLEEVCKQVPTLDELRREGPVMAREVARQKDWLMERIRAYQQSLKQEEQPEESEELEEPEEIHAAAELHAMQEQESDEERDSVFPDRSVDKPETEPTDRESTLTDGQDTLQETQKIILDIPVRQPPQREQTDTAVEHKSQKPKQTPPSRPERKPKSKPRRTAAKKQREVWPQEDVPQDVRKAEKSWRLRAQKQARRSIPVLICTLIAIYISCADDFSLLPLPTSLDYIANPGTVLWVLIVLQIVAMLFAYDVVWEGIQAVMHLMPNFSTLVDLALVFNIIHCTVRMAAEGEEIPFACIALLALFAQLRAKCSFSGARHYVFKTAANAHQPMGLFYHDGKRPHVIKVPLEDVHGFAQQTVQPDENWKQEHILTIMVMVIAVVLSLIVSVSTGDLGRIWYVLAATMTGACQISLLSAATMAQKHAARHMAKNGAAAVGRRGARKMASVDAIVLTDSDLFPAGTIALQRLELRSNLNDSTALAYAAALAGDSSLGHMLAEEVRTRYGAPLVAHHVVQYTGGAIGGQIGGLEVLLGDREFMAQRSISVHDVPENALVLALEGIAAAVLVIDYIVPAAQYTAMHELTERNLTILLHTRNQQVTPELVERLYALKKGTVILPELEQDRAMQNPQYTKRDALCGLVVRDGLVPLAGCVATAKEQTQFTRVGGVIGVCAAAICMLLMAYLCYVFVPTDARPIRMLFYAILCFVPIFFLENGVGRD